ncbi:hypothetical protein CDIK_3184, partial [Cucumispora dikerogammari]
ISSHLITKQHKDNIATETNKISENGFLNFPKKITADIILKGFTEANILLYKIRNKSITKMFEVLNITLPCETILRSKVEKLANKKRETMKNILKDQNIIFIFDESQFNNKKFVNIIASTFSKLNNKLLIKCIEISESPNYTLACQIIDDTIKEYNLTESVLSC